MDIGGTNLKLGLINDQGKVEKHEMHSMEDLLSHSNFIEALIFIAILVIALAYAWRKGALEWS